ncbi:MAG TPA: OmpW family outer membrane protein [Methylocella sp.]|nr:OmpW family outer membrane protein [Methylocella sp.]
MASTDRLTKTQDRVNPNLTRKQGGKFMTGAIKLWAAALIAVLAITRANAADLTPVPEPLPPAPPIFYVHVGALGVFYQPNAQPTGGGFLDFLPIAGGTLTNVAIRPSYTVGLEAGYFVTPNIAIALSAGVPPLLHVKAMNLNLTGALGTNLLGSARVGPIMALLQYHFTNFGAIQPYFGAGGAYVVMFSNISDGILTNFGVDQNFAFVVQGGVDYMLTQNWGVYVDVKKLIYYNPPFQGNLLNLGIPIRTLGSLDPWVIGAGVTFKY